MYDKIMKKISEAMLGVSVISLSIAIVLNAVEIFRRFLYDGSFYWIQDVTLLCMMWFIFPGTMNDNLLHWTEPLNVTKRR